MKIVSEEIISDSEETKNISDMPDELEHQEIYKLIQERQSKDNGKRYTLDEVLQDLDIDV